jgi:hypothetical protein
MRNRKPLRLRQYFKERIKQQSLLFLYLKLKFQYAIFCFLWYNMFMTIESFVKEKPYLFWYIKDLEGLSRESIVEHVLNYGDFDDFKKTVEIMGIDEIAEIFRKQLENKRINYRPEIKNYFTLYFDKYAPRNIK